MSRLRRWRGNPETLERLPVGMLERQVVGLPGLVEVEEPDQSRLKRDTKRSAWMVKARVRDYGVSNLKVWLVEPLMQAY